MSVANPSQISDWNAYYSQVPADDVPWELGGPSYELTRAISEGVLVAPARVLDIGCGLGSQTLTLAKHGFEAIGLDIAPTAIEKAEKLALFSKIETSFIIGDVCDLPFSRDMFDILYDRGCFQHLLPKQQFAYRNEIARVLTDGGTFLLSIFAQAFSARDLEGFFAPFCALVEEDIFATQEKGSDQSVIWRSLLFEKQASFYLDIN